MAKRMKSNTYFVIEYWWGAATQAACTRSAPFKTLAIAKEWRENLFRTGLSITAVRIVKVTEKEVKE